MLGLGEERRKAPLSEHHSVDITVREYKGLLEIYFLLRLKPVPENNLPDDFPSWQLFQKESSVMLLLSELTYFKRLAVLL